MSLARLLDANANRAAEALRAVEDYARFILDDGRAASALKALRHGIPAWRAAWAVALSGGFPASGAPGMADAALLAERDIPGDVGVPLKTADESERADAAAAARAGIRRAAEALRVLSEYGKALPGARGAAESCEAARYRLYALEAELFSNAFRRRKLAEACLYVLVTERFCAIDPLDACRAALAGGADIIQMREKEMEDAAFLDRALAMRELCREAGALFLVNDRCHIARLADADGAHTGRGDLPPAWARRLLGPGRILGKSTNAPERAREAALAGCDYIGAGPMFPTNTKKHRAAAGLDYARWAAAWGELKFFAIGSVNRGTLPSVLAAGARAVAVCTAITQAGDVEAEARWFKERLAEARDRPLDSEISSPYNEIIPCG